MHPQKEHCRAGLVIVLKPWPAGTGNTSATRHSDRDLVMEDSWGVNAQQRHSRSSKMLHTKICLMLQESSCHSCPALAHLLQFSQKPHPCCACSFLLRIDCKTQVDRDTAAQESDVCWASTLLSAIQYTKQCVAPARCCCMNDDYSTGQDDAMRLTLDDAWA